MKEQSRTYRLKEFVVVTHLRKWPLFYWTDALEYRSTHSAHKLRFKKLKVIPLDGYQFELNFDE